MATATTATAGDAPSSISKPATVSLPVLLGVVVVLISLALGVGLGVGLSSRQVIVGAPPPPAVKPTPPTVRKVVVSNIQISLNSVEPNPNVESYQALGEVFEGTVDSYSAQPVGRWYGEFVDESFTIAGVSSVYRSRESTFLFSDGALLCEGYVTYVAPRPDNTSSILLYTPVLNAITGGTGIYAGSQGVFSVKQLGSALTFGYTLAFRSQPDLNALVNA